jgi:thioesterase domain-containing protein
MDTPCGDQMPPRPSEADVLRQVLPSGAVLPPDAELRGLPLEERLERALAAARAEGAAAAPRGAGAAALGGYDFVEGLRLLRVLDANVAALYAYRPLPYPGAALFFRAGERPEGEPPHPELPWIDLAAAGCEVHVVPGNHFTMHEAPQVREMAARLRLRLAAAGI